MTDELNDCQGERCSVCGGYGFYRENDGDFRTCGCPKGDDWPAPSSRERRMTDNKSLGQIAYEAWFGSLSLKDGKTPMDWPGDMHKDDWEAAASAVRCAVIDECIQIVSAGVKWEPEEFYSDTHIKASNETAYLLTKALEGLKGETDV